MTKKATIPKMEIVRENWAEVALYLTFVALSVITLIYVIGSVL